ncbi:MAG: accessory Sec system translocase SecA2 [Planctomycetaceae bacterium]|nr:accessory Sec system translocase SecA2 [Planctomycetaceae bacterium]
MFDKLTQAFGRLRGGATEVSLRPYRRLLAKIAEHERELRRCTDDRLRSTVGDLQQQLAAGSSLESCLPRTFAVVREVAHRVLSQRPYDEQMLAGVALHRGRVVQLQTGEGKTLAAVAPAVLNGLTGRGVHILTFNNYLAQRDAAWMGPIFQFLGMTVGCVVPAQPRVVRREAYTRDVTYVTAQQAGFDYLRDQLALELDLQVHRSHHFAIVDEADSILIDEARVPLVIAGEMPEPAVDVSVLAELVSELKCQEHYEIGDRARNVHFTSAGLDCLERELGCGDLHEESRLPLLTRLNQALHAECLLRRDVDYIVREGCVVLLDELTGRVAPQRRWPYGLHAAVEAKERLPIQRPGKILGSITLQHFVGLYDKLSGMTGTAEQAAEEFHGFYDLKVTVVPTHKPCAREDQADLTFTTRTAKFAEVVRLVRQKHDSGQPVLVGTASVQESEFFLEQLRAAGIPCRVLNARNDHEEACIIAAAGQFGAVTISTNMAGRGIDIKLGGHGQADDHRVRARGGLFVIGTNRHESRRIDNQLRGRSARQGDPGQTRFVISLEDDLLRRFGIEDSLRGLSLERSSEDSIGNPQVTAKVAHIQRVVEGECFEIRRTLRRYSQVLEGHRQAIVRRRQEYLDDAAAAYILEDRAPQRYAELLQQFGRAVLRRVERQIAIWQIDQCWADHLELMAETRDTIHLFSLGGLDPYFEYQQRASKAYRDMLQRLDDTIVDRFNAAQVTAAGLDLEREQLLRPAATWTYMITDHPVGDVFDRLARRVRRLLSGN